MKGIIGKKVGMTGVYGEDGRYQSLTVIEAGPCVVTQLRSQDVDGYTAVQLGFDDKKEKRASAAAKGHFAKANSEVKKVVKEFRNFSLSVNVGDELGADVFQVGDKIEISGTSKGKGFQGVVKRHGFAGVGMGSHGQHNRLRAPGSIGACATPSRVFKGVRMAGKMGNKTVTVKNLKVVQVFPEQNVLVVSGAVPGATGSYVTIVSK